MNTRIFTWKNLQIIGAKNDGQIVEGFTIAKGLQQFLSNKRRAQMTTLSLIIGENTL